MDYRLSIFVMALTSVYVMGYKLPQNVDPLLHSIELTLNEEIFLGTSDQFSVYETIRLSPYGTTNLVHLHGDLDYLAIHDIRVVVDGVDFSTTYSYNDTIKVLTMVLSQTMPFYNVYLYANYTGRVSNDGRGIFRSSSGSGYFLGTNFEPIFARRAFPCMDEPTFKTGFAINVTHPAGVHFLGNQAGSRVESGSSSLITTQMDSTYNLSPHSFAFLISDVLCETSNISQNLTGVPINVCSMPNTNKSPNFALEVAPKLLQQLNEYTNYYYGRMGVSKLDLVAIPNLEEDSIANFGLIMFKEDLLLSDPKESSVQHEQTATRFIARQLARLWFGRLITPAWWSDKFLSDAFALYFEYFTTQQLFPEWNLDMHFTVNAFQEAFEEDSILTSPPLATNVDENDEAVIGAFKTPTTLKGAFLLRMVEGVMGSGNFKVGMQNYVSSYKNTNPPIVYLWNMLNPQLNRDLLPPGVRLYQVMENWTNDPGFPLVEVVYNEGSVVISQVGRFLFSGNNHSSRWYIPITYTFSSNKTSFEDTSPMTWLTPTNSTSIPWPLDADWIILNNKANAYYRVYYDDFLWRGLNEALMSQEFGGIPELTRAQLVDDAFNLARINKRGYAEVLRMMHFLRNDSSFYPWTVALKGYDFLLSMAGLESPLGRAIKAEVLNLMSVVYESASWQKINVSDHAFTLKQVEILSTACNFGHKDCIDNALREFRQFRSSGNSPDVNFKSIVYCSDVKYGNVLTDWYRLFDAYRTSDTYEERISLVKSLGCTSNENLLHEFLEVSLENTNPDDIAEVFKAVISNSAIGIRAVFEFLKENYRILDENVLKTAIAAMAQKVTDVAVIQEVKLFITLEDLPQNVIETADASLKIAEDHQKWLSQFWVELHEYYGLDPTSTTTTTRTSTTKVTTTALPTTNRGDCLNSSLWALLMVLIKL